ncbi:hypothetical protein Fmac_011272 [Flemingia macrophylla]|uniref:Wound-induced basic protein n=1 Tax=Flemingia macrophylla TaxID=520843 RepID=A0ABD1MMA2_9FABA
MIYDVNSPLFRSFLSQKGGSSDKRKADEQKPKEQKPKASENKPIMTEPEERLASRYSLEHQKTNETWGQNHWGRTLVV